MFFFNHRCVDYTVHLVVAWQDRPQECYIGLPENSPPIGIGLHCAKYLGHFTLWIPYMLPRPSLVYVSRQKPIPHNLVKTPPHYALKSIFEGHTAKTSFYMSKNIFCTVYTLHILTRSLIKGNYIYSITRTTTHIYRMYST